MPGRPFPVSYTTAVTRPLLVKKFCTGSALFIFSNLIRSSLFIKVDNLVEFLLRREHKKERGRLHKQQTV